MTLLPGVLQRGTYGDLFVLEAPTDEKTGKRKKDIPVDAVRQLIRTFSQKRTHQGGWRLVFVDPCRGSKHSCRQCSFKDPGRTSSPNSVSSVLPMPPAVLWQLCGRDAGL